MIIFGKCCLHTKQMVPSSKETIQGFFLSALKCFIQPILEADTGDVLLK